jgi:Pyruvate/2-oxoacid:ferredoxin oxidoreductase gamma subunit
LSATKKGEYPITIGTGFSIAEVIFSHQEIHYTGIESPDVMIITSQDGFETVKDRIGPHTRLILDTKVDAAAYPHTTSVDFHKQAGKKGAALAAVTCWLQDSGLLPIEALIEAAGRHKHADALIATIESVG